MDSVHEDSMNIPDNSFKKIYKRDNPTLKYSYEEATQTHNYSKNWDFDGDGRTDDLCFIGNHGTHLYFHLKLVLSSDSLVRDFPFLNLDFPVLGSINELEKISSETKAFYPQFVIYDFDTDGKDEIFLNFDFKDAVIPTKWKSKINSRYVQIDYKDGDIRIKNFLD